MRAVENGTRTEVWSGVGGLPRSASVPRCRGCHWAPSRPERLGIAPGFTLIELMIVIVVLAVLVAIAYPSYVTFVTRSDRSDAREALAAVLIAQERFRAIPANTTYAATVGGLGLPAVSPRGLYDISIDASPTRSTFTARATVPAGSSQERDRAVCQDLWVTVTPAGETRNPPECW
jgi:type IV pilus assembly protein PilE